jgi:hypothetical protein
MNKEVIRAIHSRVCGWMADNTKLMNSSIIYSIDTQSWHYFYEDPMNGDPMDKELVSARQISELNEEQVFNNLISEIRIIERNILNKTEESLKTEYDDSDDLTDKQKHRLDMIAVNYVKLCGEC